MTKTILIVDDDMLITTTLSTLIEMTLDYNVLTSNNPAQALELDELKQKKIDMIISDFMMPEMNGLEFLKKAAEVHPEAVVILLTGYADKQNAIRCINELGIYYYLEKPWDNDILLKIIKNGLEKKDLQNEIKQNIIELEKSNQEISRLYSLLENNYNQEVNKNEELNQWNRKLEYAVAERTASLRNLLDNAGQGFLTFDSDLIVHPQYSLECINIFGRNIQNSRFSELIFPDDTEQRNFLEVMLSNILSKKSDNRLEIYLSLLPSEVKINNRFIEVKYKLTSPPDTMDQKSFMVILTDITDKRNLENKIEEERNTLRMVVKAIVYYSELMDCINDYHCFFGEKAYSILKSSRSMEDMIYEIFRHVHTFKGSFSQLDMTGISSKLHELEERLSELKARHYEVSTDEIRKLFEKSDFEHWLNNELDILKNYLGKDFFKQRDLLFVDKTRLIEIEKKIISILPPAECRLILPDIRQLRYKPFRELLKTYPDYVIRLSEKLEKPVHDFDVEGGNFLVDIDKYNEFGKTLVHIFRNILDHGIENTDDRIALGKDYCGTIKCSISIDNKNIKLIISDDGCGMDPRLIRQKALEKGLISQEEVNTLTDSDILMLIFENGFSTKENVSELSGRGVGLSAVQKELLRLGGRVSLSTRLNEGTEFCFMLPYEEISAISEISITSIMNPIIEVTKDFILNYTGESITSVDNFNIEKPDKLLLKEYTAFINIKGALRGMFIISIDEKLLRRIIKKFILGSLDPKDENVYLEDVLAECSNTILGNSIKKFPGLENLLAITTPITISSNNALVKYPESIIWTCAMETTKGNLGLSFITTHDANII
ncbi:MAG: response regulator [Bacillota bacterium]